MHVRFRLAIALAAAVLAAGCTNGFFGGVQNQTTKPGDAASDLLSNAKYSKLVVEIHAVPGSEPHKDAIAELKKVVAENTAKGTPDVRIHADLPAKGQDHKYTWREIEGLERDHRKGYASGDTITLSILYLDGGSEADEENAQVLGAAYRATSLVMFKGNIRKNTVPDGTLVNLGQSEIRYVERAVMVHELGHAFGLVNNGIEMVTPHEDPEHPHHSASKESVMYWAVESSAFLRLFSRGADIPYQFDANDKADMKAVREA